MLNFVRRVYKNRFFETAIIGLIFLFGIFLIGCASIPDPVTAENIPGLSVNPENSAYLGGRIGAIGNYDFNAGSGVKVSNPERILRVPAGQKMIVSVYYIYFYYFFGFWGYSKGFMPIIIPPLENEGVYRISIKGFATRAILEKFNNDTKKYEKVKGAAFVGQ